ncbi:MAG: VPLPA-CTERM sorting domain-containing protein [Paracoccus sp. (in: a-proteobacteria)]|uniref:VPLPA-CTERM sorting domain-containing protein n=1 Tax=Paracoccus sp. TaxID=267 RepID=UPI0026DEE82A|nr:VPLPA-CTERM sorting domain-containing protein [Paracoccus sp. (in: a-proteobacteria)]MDO5612139.1 VPLPA-CTERM sorting domain-containing protein [Paracoccus sp. (in: a-proteobacteria)]
MVPSIFKTAAVAGAVTLASLTAASAATTSIVANDSYLSVGGIVSAPGTSFQYDYTASEDLTVDQIALSAVGGASDVGKITATLVGTSESTVIAPYNSGLVSFGGGFLSGFALKAGESFSILFDVLAGDALTNGVGVQVSFDTMAPAPVPVPAAAGLLVTALGGLGFAARRKRKSA